MSKTALNPKLGQKRPISAELPTTLHDGQGLNFKQSAMLLGVSLSTMRRLHQTGKLPTIRLSERRLGLRVADLKAMTNTAA